MGFGRLFSVFLKAVLLTSYTLAGDKRLLLHSDMDLATAVAIMQTQIEKLETQQTNDAAEIASLKAHLSFTGHGSTYTRWGRTTCPGNGTEIVYKGFTAGNWYSSQGGAADYICLAQEPLWGVYDDTAAPSGARIYGTEYEFGENHGDGGAKFFGSNLYQHDVPCSVCHTTRSATVMIPGRNQCYPGWTMEYSGYLVSGRNVDTYDVSASNYACLDTTPETNNYDYKNENGKLMVLVEAKCGSLACPPYVDNREITCVVCSK